MTIYTQKFAFKRSLCIRQLTMVFTVLIFFAVHNVSRLTRNRSKATRIF